MPSMLFHRLPRRCPLIVSPARCVMPQQESARCALRTETHQPLGSRTKCRTPDYRPLLSVLGLLSCFGVCSFVVPSEGVGPQEVCVVTDPKLAIEAWEQRDIAHLNDLATTELAMAVLSRLDVEHRSRFITLADLKPLLAELKRTGEPWPALSRRVPSCQRNGYQLMVQRHVLHEPGELFVQLKPIGVNSAARLIEYRSKALSDAELSPEFARILGQAFSDINGPVSTERDAEDDFPLGFEKVSLSDHLDVAMVRVQRELALRGPADQEVEELRLQENLRTLVSILQRRPDYIPARLERAKTLTRLYERGLANDPTLLDAAITELDAVERIATQNGTWLDAFYYLLRERTYRWSRDTEKAREALKEAVTKDHTGRAAYVEAASKRGDWEALTPTARWDRRHLVAEAINGFQVALGANPLLFDAQADLGLLYGMIGDNWRAGLLFDEVLKILPDHPTTLFDQTIVNWWNKDYHGALSNLRTLERVGRYTSAGEVFKFRAIIYQQMPDKSPAIVERELLCSFLATSSRARRVFNADLPRGFSDNLQAALNDKPGADGLNCGILAQRLAKTRLREADAKKLEDQYREVLWNRMNAPEFLVRARREIGAARTDSVTLDESMLLALIAGHLREETRSQHYIAEFQADYPDPFSGVWVVVSRIYEMLGREEDTGRYRSLGAELLASPWKPPIDGGNGAVSTHD